MTILNLFKYVIYSCVAIAAISFIPSSHLATFESEKHMNNPPEDKKLHFGNFSVSLAVKDINASQAFYKKLDFEKIGGDVKHNYLIMQNGTTTIGLFQGMFKENILTFNPGWDHKSQKLAKFQDVRELQSVLQKRGVTPAKAADEDSEGPASFVIVDPDGNSILVDQHVPKP